MQNKSFTLIELLVVIVIIGILAGVIVVSVSSSINKANFAKAQSFSNTVQNELLGDLVSEWTFNSEAVANTTEDSWGNNDGTVSGATYRPKSSRECVYGSCYKFDGTDDYINFGNENDFNFAKEDSFTFSVWVKRIGDILGTTKVAGILINGEDFVGRYGIDYYQSSNQLRCGVRETASYVAIALPQNNLLDWTYVVFTYEPNNSTGIKLYLNGFLENSVTSVNVTILENTNLKIAANHTLGGDRNYFNGLIDDVRIYDKALSSAQIKQQYVAGLDSLLSKNLISQDEYNDKLETLAQN